MADYDIPVYPGTMRYNPQVKDHGIIIGCLIFHGISKTRSLLSASVTLWRSIATDIYPPPSVVPATAAQSLSSFWRTVLLYCVLGLQCRIRLAGWVWHPIQEHSKWFGSTVNGLGTRRMAGKHYLIFRGVSSVL